MEAQTTIHTNVMTHGSGHEIDSSTSRWSSAIGRVRTTSPGPIRREVRMVDAAATTVAAIAPHHAHKWPRHVPHANTPHTTRTTIHSAAPAAPDSIKPKNGMAQPYAGIASTEIAPSAPHHRERQDARWDAVGELCPGVASATRGGDIRRAIEEDECCGQENVDKTENDEDDG